MLTTVTLLEAIKRAHEIGSQAEDEDEPYKHKYEAADVLRAALGERALTAQGSAAQAAGDSADAPHPLTQDATPGLAAVSQEAACVPALTKPSPLDEAAAAARIRCGLILLETDLLTDGEASVKRGLPVLERCPDTFMAWLLESYNALGALYCQRGDMPTALEWLQKAETLYQRVTGTGTRHAHLRLPAHLVSTQTADAEASAGDSGGADGSTGAGAGDRGGNEEQVGVDGGAAAADTLLETHPAPESSALQLPGPGASTATAEATEQPKAELAARAATSDEGAAAEPVPTDPAAEGQDRADAGAQSHGADAVSVVIGSSEPSSSGTGQEPASAGSEAGACRESTSAAEPAVSENGRPSVPLPSAGAGAAEEPSDGRLPSCKDSAGAAHAEVDALGGTAITATASEAEASKPAAEPAKAAEVAACIGPEGGAADGNNAASAGSLSAAAPSGTDGDGRQTAETPTSTATEATSDLRLPSCDPDAIQAQYTSTMFYLAQVYGNMKLQDRSALYCAATLYRQLASGKYDLDTWVNNCLQLGGYYAKVNAFALAMYCHAAAQAVADRDTAAGAVLGEDIAANIKLATARVYNMRLAASHSKYIENKDLEVHYPDVSYFPDYLRFKGLEMPSPDSFPWGLNALASTFEGARDLLNSGMPYFKEALSYYQLDGWVTDHVGILMDMSNMYRCLASFEADPNRAAAMHRCRAQLLEPLSGGLNPDHYPGLSRSIDLELAHVYREISDIREVQGGQAAKVASAAASAAKFYQRFLRSFTSAETQQMPDRVDPDNEPYFLMASFGLGRMLQRIRPSGNATDASYNALAVAAHKHLQWTSEYVRRHGLETWTQEARAAEELSELLVEQIRLRAMAAGRRAA